MAEEYAIVAHNILKKRGEGFRKPNVEVQKYRNSLTRSGKRFTEIYVPYESDVSDISDAVKLACPIVQWLEEYAIAGQNFTIFIMHERIIY